MIAIFLPLMIENSSERKCAEYSPYDERDQLKERVEELTKEKTALQQRISELETEVERQKEKAALQRRVGELEAEVERLNVLLLEKKKKRTGTGRKFTLEQIADYCKGCVSWDDVKMIVAMLNKLLRRVGTDEDSQIVDSIETEFRQRIYGQSFPNAQITMQTPQIQGPLYEVSGNTNVNLGGNSHERE